MGYVAIDVETWDRREYFDAYRGADFPYINIGAHLDVTSLLKFSDERDLSSYLALVFAAHHVAERIPNFRYRIKDGQPIMTESMCPSFTYLPEGRELFISVTIEFVDDVLEFHERAKNAAIRQGADPGLKDHRGRYDIIMYSGVPWIQYIHIVRTIAKIGIDSNPKISWGRYFRENGRMLVPFSVQVHHGLMDGFHVGRYFEELQRYVDGLA